MAELPVSTVTPLVAKHLDFSCVSCGVEVNVLSYLPCLHSVSVCEKKQCHQNLLDRKATCSHCKETFPFLAEGFPRYIFAERESIGKERQEKGAFCSEEHESPQLAVVYCSSCPGPLCEECHSVHKTAAFLKKHEIVSLHDALKGELAEQCHLPHCSAHKKELECFCQDCEVPICALCPVVGLHQSHRVLLIDKEMNEMTEQAFVQCITAVKKRTDELSHATSHADDQLFTLHEKCNQSTEGISELKDRMIEIVTNYCACLISEVKEAERKKTGDLKEYKKILQHQRNQLELFKTFADKVVRSGTKIEQLSIRRAVIQRASRLTFTSIPPPPPSSSRIHFLSEYTEAIEKVVSQMGHLSWGADPQTSTTEHLTFANNAVECRPWARIPLTLGVVTRDHSGRQCVFGGENVKSALTPTTCGVPVLGKVEDNGDGAYQVTFGNVPSEECELTVTVNGVHIKGSPVIAKAGFPVTIKQEIKDSKQRDFESLVLTKEGSLLVTDDKNRAVLIFAKSGEKLGGFKVPWPGGDLGGIASLSDGNIALSMPRQDCIAVYKPNGRLVKEFGSDRLEEPKGLALNNKGQLFVVEGKGARISVYSESGEFQYSFGSRGSQPGELDSAQEICIGNDSLLYISDGRNQCIQVFQQDGSFVRQFGKGILIGPTGVAPTKDGRIVVTSPWKSKLSVFLLTGECVHEIKDAGVLRPCGVAVDDDGFIFVTDRFYDGKIVKL